MQAPRIVVDLAQFPLVVQSVSPGHSVADLEHMFEVYEQLLRGQQRYAIVVYFDADAALLGAQQRRRVAEWWSSHKARVEELNVMSVTVTPSAWVRGALTAIQWFTQPKNPQRVSATVSEAIDICVEALEQAGVAISNTALAGARGRYGRLSGRI